VSARSQGVVVNHRLVAFLAGAIAASPLAAAPAPSSYKPVLLEQLSPLVTGNGNNLSIQYRSGWPLIYRAAVKDKDMVGIGRMYGPQGYDGRWAFPEVGQGGGIVFDNPDGAWSYSAMEFFPRYDEQLLDFYPDPGDISNTQDDALGAPFNHNVFEQLFYRPEFGGPAPLIDLNGTESPSVAQDGVQFGADDDFPGLVLLSDVGPGIVMTNLSDGWTPVQPRQARNLAGFTNSVGYELTDKLGRTSITAMMVVPRFLFSRIRIVDPCVGIVAVDLEGQPTACSGPPVQRIDGGPPGPEVAIDESVVEIRAFVVAPVWNVPFGRLDYLNFVSDMNGDGKVTAADAQAMGRRVLSNEVVYTFRQIGSDVTNARYPEYSLFSYCNGRTRPDSGSRAGGTNFVYDIDGNGYANLVDSGVCPLGGSGVTRPPR